MVAGSAKDIILSDNLRGEQFRPVGVDIPCPHCNHTSMVAYHGTIKCLDCGFSETLEPQGKQRKQESISRFESKILFTALTLISIWGVLQYGINQIDKNCFVNGVANTVSECLRSGETRNANPSGPMNSRPVGGLSN
jgi:ribosomal protein S27E